MLSGEKKEPFDWENFNETIDIYFMVKNEEARIVKYKITVVSLKWLEEKKELGCYVRNCIVQEYFNLPAIEFHIKQILKACQFLSLDEEIVCLNNHFEFEG